MPYPKRWRPIAENRSQNPVSGRRHDTSTRHHEKRRHEGCRGGKWKWAFESFIHKQWKKCSSFVNNKKCCAVSGAVCASSLAKNGVSVTIFESARGPGGRMSQRRFFLQPIISNHSYYVKGLFDFAMLCF